MDGVDFIQGIEDGSIDRTQAISHCIELYRTSWSTIAIIRQAFVALEEDVTVVQLSEALDKIEFAMDEHFSIDEDGVVTVRNPE